MVLQLYEVFNVADKLFEKVEYEFKEINSASVSLRSQQESGASVARSSAEKLYLIIQKSEPDNPLLKARLRRIGERKNRMIISCF